MRKIIASLLVAVLALIPLSALANVPPPPEFTGYVYDYANIITHADEARINAYAEDVSALQAGQVIVVTVNSLDDAPIKDYALELFNTWGIGSAKKNDGVLILLAPNDGQVWIAVGSGIDTILTVEDCGTLIDDHAFDLFAQSKFSEGLCALAKATCVKMALLLSQLFDDPALIAQLAAN